MLNASDLFILLIMMHPHLNKKVSGSKQQFGSRNLLVQSSSLQKVELTQQKSTYVWTLKPSYSVVSAKKSVSFHRMYSANLSKGDLRLKIPIPPPRAGGICDHLEYTHEKWLIRLKGQKSENQSVSSMHSTTYGLQ